MNLWVRSQNKEDLVAANRFEVQSTKIYTFCQSATEENWIRIGEYSSNERAMEVMNEIQDKIWQILNGEPCIYQMPKE